MTTVGKAKVGRSVSNKLFASITLSMSVAWIDWTGGCWREKEVEKRGTMVKMLLKGGEKENSVKAKKENK